MAVNGVIDFVLFPRSRPRGTALSRRARSPVISRKSRISRKCKHSTSCYLSKLFVLLSLIKSRVYVTLSPFAFTFFLFSSSSLRWTTLCYCWPCRVDVVMANGGWRECANWLTRCGAIRADHKVNWPESTVDDLAHTLRDGVILCNLLNILVPECLGTKDIHQKPQMAQVII